jgi:hypothetical protein
MTIGPYDYESPSAKFIVVSLANIGLGANIRGGAAYGLLFGLAADRVVILLNDSPTGLEFLLAPSLLVSFDDDEEKMGSTTHSTGRFGTGHRRP